jgi:PKD repeat protein
MDHNGWKGVLKLWSVPDDPLEQLPNIQGTYTGLDGIPYDVRGYVRTPTYPIPGTWGPDHKIEFYISFADETKFDGYLWTGTKNTIAGTTYWHGITYGFYALRALRVFPGCTYPPTDPDGDGIYEDLNGNGRLDFADVVLYFNQMTWLGANQPVASFDLNGNGRIDFADIVALFNEI